MSAHIVAISGGKYSTAMALRLAEVEPRDYEFVITPTGRELPDMVAHWKRLECLLGKSLTVAPGPTLVEQIVKYKTLPNWRIRFCTREVKIEPFMLFVSERSPAVAYVGIRADEVGGEGGREGTNWSGVDGVTQDFPLVRWGWGINRVKEYLSDRGVEIPERTDCDLCFFQRLAEWWRLWKLHPQRYQEAEALEDFTGHTLRSEQRDSWPASLKTLRERFELGYTPKGADQLTLKLDVSDRSTMCAWCAR